MMNWLLSEVANRGEERPFTTFTISFHQIFATVHNFRPQCITFVHSAKLAVTAPHCNIFPRPFDSDQKPWEMFFIEFSLTIVCIKYSCLPWSFIYLILLSMYLGGRWFETFLEHFALIRVWRSTLSEVCHPQKWVWTKSMKIEQIEWKFDKYKGDSRTNKKENQTNRKGRMKKYE